MLALESTKVFKDIMKAVVDHLYKNHHQALCNHCFCGFDASLGDEPNQKEMGDINATDEQIAAILWICQYADDRNYNPFLNTFRKKKGIFYSFLEKLRRMADVHDCHSELFTQN